MNPDSPLHFLVRKIPQERRVPDRREGLGSVGQQNHELLWKRQCAGLFVSVSVHEVVGKGNRTRDLWALEK